MIHNEIRDTVWLGISLILLAIILTFVVYLMGVRSDLADIKNAQATTDSELHEYAKYNQYNNVRVQGIDIASAVRDYYKEGIRIGVKDANGLLMYEVDDQLAKANPSLVDFDFLTATFPVEQYYTAYVVHSVAYSKLLNQVKWDKTKNQMYYSGSEGIVYAKDANDGGQVQAIIFFKN